MRKTFEIPDVGALTVKRVDGELWLSFEAAEDDAAKAVFDKTGYIEGIAADVVQEGVSAIRAFRRHGLDLDDPQVVAAIRLCRLAISVDPTTLGLPPRPSLVVRDA